MTKKKGRKKVRHQDFRVSGGPGVYYAQRKCETCGVLIMGRSPETYRQANLDLGNKLKAHREDCEGKQLDLSLPGKEGKQSQTIKKVSLRGEEK